MTQSIVAGDLIRRSMYLINAIAAGDVLKPTDGNDALLALNEMIDSWSTESLSVYGEANESRVLTPGIANYTWGTGGDWTTTRPVRIDGVTCIRDGVSTPVKIINQEEYDSIPVKATQSDLVERLLYVNSYPLGLVTLYPVPSDSVTLSIATARVLTNIPNLQTVIHLPPGYLRALRYCLAVDLWPEYNNPQTDINTIKAIAIKSKGNIAIANQVDVLSNFTDIPNVDYGRSWDWREG